MKTTKFLTILFALILGAAIDATAQSSTTTTVTPVNGKTNQWSFTMPAGNVKLNATFLLTTDKIAELINTTKEYDGVYWANAKEGKYYPTTSASLNGNTYLTYTNEDNETVYIKLTAKYMKSDGVAAATNAGTASSILVTLDGVYVKGDDNQMTKQDNYEFAGTATYALNDGKFSIPDASIDYYDLSSLLTWDNVKNDITCVKPYDGTSVAEVKNDGQQYEVTTSFGTPLYIFADADFTETKGETTATVSNVGTGYGIRIEFKLKDGQDSYTLGTSNGARQTSLTIDYAPTDGVVAKINPIDISSYMAYTDWVGDMGANIISTKAHDGTAAAEIINPTKTIDGETINSVQETVTLTVSDAYFMNGAAQTSEVGNDYDIQYKISVPSDGHYCLGFDGTGEPQYSVTKALSGANIRAAYAMTLSIADYDYGSPSVPEVKNGTDVIPTTTIAASSSPYTFNVKSGDSWLEYPVAYDQLQIDYLKTSEAGNYTLKVIYDDGISYGEAICDFTVSLATPNPTVVAKDDLTYISKNTSQELVDFNSVSYPYTVLFSLTGEDGSYSAVIPTGKKASTYTVYYKVDAVQDKYAALAAQTVDVTIAKKQLDLTVTGDAITKDYDGTTNANVSGLTVTLPTTIAAGEDVSIDNVTGEFPDAAAGSYTIANNKPVTIGVTLTGADAQNYEVNDAQYNGTINVKTISIPLGLGADYTFSFPKEDLTFTPASSAVGKVACVYDAADSKYHITTVTSGITAGDYILTSNNNSLEVQVKIDNGLISTFFNGTWRKYIRFVAPTAYTSGGESFARLGMARTATGTANITTYDSPFPATAKLYINDAEVGDAGYEIETAGTSTITYTLKDDNGIIHSTSNTVKLDNVAPDTPATITYTDENGAEHTINGYETEDKAKTAANYVKIPKGTTISYHPTDLPKDDNSGAYLYNSLNSGPFASLGSVENKETMITVGQSLIKYYTQDGVGNVTTNGNNPNVIYRYIMFDVRDVYTVTFDANGHGTTPAAQKVFDGDKITEPTITTPNGYALLGWTYTDGSETKTWDFDNNTVTGNITLTANWIANNFTAKYTDDGREVSVPFESLGAALGYASYPSDVDVTITQNVSLYEETNTPLSMVTGHKFTLQLKTVTNATINVATGNTLAIESGTIKTSTADYALKITGGSVSLSGGTYTGTTAAIYNSAYINGNRVKILADGKAFFYGDPLQMIYGDNGDGAAYYEIYRDNQIASRGDVLDKVEKTVEVNGALTLYAVSIDANGGDWDGNSPNTTQLVIEGGKAEAPDDPVLEGHSFDGWYYYLDPDHPEAGDAEWSFDNKVDKDYSLHAKYSKLKYTVSLPSNMEFADGSATPSDDGKYDYGTTIKIKVKDGYIVVGDVDYKYGTDATTYSLPTSLTPENGVYSFEVPEGDVVVTADVRAIQTITTAEIAALISTTKPYDGGYWANAKDGKYYNPYNTDPALSGTTMLIYVNDNVTPRETVYFPVTAKYVKSTTDDATGKTTYTETKNVTEANAIEVEVLDENAYSLESDILSQLPNYTFAASDAYPFVSDTKFYITNDVAIAPKNLSPTIAGTIEKEYNGTTTWDITSQASINNPQEQIISGDNVTIKTATATFPGTVPMTYQKSVELSYVLDNANYIVANTNKVTGTIKDISATLTAGLGAEIKLSVPNVAELKGSADDGEINITSKTEGSNTTYYLTTTANATTTSESATELKIMDTDGNKVGSVNVTVKDYTPENVFDDDWHNSISIPSTNTLAESDFINDENRPDYKVSVNNLTANNNGNFVVNTEGANVPVTYTLTDNDGTNTYHSVTKTVKIDKTTPGKPTVTYGDENTQITCGTASSPTAITLPTGTTLNISATDALSGVASFWTSATDQISGTINKNTEQTTSYSIAYTLPTAGSYSWALKAKDAADNESEVCYVDITAKNIVTPPTNWTNYVYTKKAYDHTSNARKTGIDYVPCSYTNTEGTTTTVNASITAKFVDADGNEVLNAGEEKAYKVQITLELKNSDNYIFSQDSPYSTTITLGDCTIEKCHLRATYGTEVNLEALLTKEYDTPVSDIIDKIGDPTGLEGVVTEYNNNDEVVYQDVVHATLSNIKYFDRTTDKETNAVGSCLARMLYECDNSNYIVDPTNSYAEITKSNVTLELAINNNGGWTYGSYPTGDYDGYNPAVFTITKNGGQELSEKEKSSVLIFVQDSWMGANQYEENALASLPAGTYKRVYVTIPQYLTYLDEEFSNYKYTQSDYVTLTVAPKPITLANISITKTYDGSRALPTTFVPTIKDGEVLANDEVSVAIMDVTENDPSNLYPSAEASSTGYDVPLKLKLTGAQADNYVLSGWDAKTYTENHYDNNTNELQPLSESDKTEDEQRYFSKEIAEYFTKTVKGTITNATISATATSYNGTYDRQSHNITVNVTKPTTGYTIMYGTEEGTYDKTADEIAQTDVCSGMTIYYKVSADNFDPVTGSSTITIQPKTITAPTIVVRPQSFTYDGTKKTPTVTVYDGPVSDNIDITSECEINITGDVEVGTAYVNITDKQNGNYNVSGQATFKISAAPVTITFNGNGGTLGDLYPSAPTATVNYDGTDATNSYTIPSASDKYYTREGYTLSGWNTVENPTEANPGESYKADGTSAIAINGTDNLTLYAQWDKYELQVYKNSITIYKSDNNNAVTKGQLAYRVKKNDDVMEENAPEVTVTTDNDITCSNAVGPVDFNMNPNTTDNYTVRSVATTQGGTITLSLPGYNCANATVTVTIETVTVTAKMEDGTDFDDTKYYEPGTQLVVTVSQNFPIDVRTTSYNFATEKDVNGKKWTCTPNDNISEATFDLSVHSCADKGTNTDDVTFAAYVVKYKLPAIGYTATAYNGEYDGEDHGITVNVSEPATGAIIKYGTAKGTYNLDEYMETNVCDGKVVYFQITAEGHEPVEDSRTITIRPKTLTNPTIVLNPTSFTYDGTEKTPTVIVYDGDENTGVDITDECNINITGNVEVGTAYVNITDKEGGNYNVSGQKTFEISTAPVTITFNGNGGTLNSTYASAPKAKIDYDGTDVTNSYTIPSASDKYYTREGYTLSGWNTVENPTEANSGESYKADGTSAIAINGADLTLYAKWTPVEYSITYNGLENATNASTNPATYTVESEAITFTAAERDHYDFGGWFSDALCSEGNEVTGIAAGSTGNKEVYAKFTPTAYNITYNGLENAINASTNPATYTVESETFTLANPTKTGYTFFGWTGSNGNTPQKSVTITKGSYGNKNYTAKWDINQYYIDLPANMEFVTANNNNGKFPYSMEVQFKVSAGYQVVGEVMYGNDELTATNGIYTIAAMPAADVTITATVKKEITATVALNNWTYGQSPNDPVVTVDDNQISTGYTITYKKQGETDDTYTETTPSNAGDYTVRAVIAATDAHLSATATTDFSIEPATPTLNVFAHSYICGSGEWSAPDGFFAYRSDNSGTHLPGSWTLMSGTVTSTGSYKAQFTPTDKQNYTWAVSDEFKITFNNKPLPDGIALVEPNATITYDGTAKTPTIAGLGALTEGETNDYVISYANNINAGTAASYTVTGKGCYAGSEKSDYFTIAKASLTVTANNHTITYGDALDNNGVQYDGFVNNETATVLGGKLAYDYSYTKYGNVGGNYTITPKGLTSANYEIEYQSGTLTVEPKEIGIAWSEATEFPYDGDSHILAATATGLVNGDQCSLTVEGSGIVVGEYTAKVAALSNSNYKLPTDQSKLNKTFKITAASIEYTAADYTGTYDGQSHAISVSVSKPATGAKVLYSTSKTGDFTATPITVTNVKDNKTVYFKISADNYTPTAVDSRKIELQPLSVENPTISFVNTESPTYNGSKQEPSVTVAIDNKTLTEGTDYTVEYTNHTNAGKATVTINSVENGNYTFTGTVSTTFDIVPADIDQSAVTALLSFIYCPYA